MRTSPFLESDKPATGSKPAGADVVPGSPVSIVGKWETIFSAASFDSLADRRSPIPLDSPFVQQTKDKIRELIAEISRFSQQPVEPADFLQFAFPRILTAMGGSSIALWSWRPEQKWQLVQSRGMPLNLFQTSSHDTLSAEQSDQTSVTDSSFEQMESQLEAALGELQDADSRQGVESHWSSIESTLRPALHLRPSSDHQALLDEVKREGQPILVPPSDKSLSTHHATNPCSHSILLAPLSLSLPDGELWLEVLQQPGGGQASQRGYLRFVAQMSDLLADFFKSFRTRMLERDQKFLVVAQSLIDQATYSGSMVKRLSQVLATIRDHMLAEHTILFERSSNGRVWKVRAIAGLPKVDRRAAGISVLESAAVSIFEQANSYCDYRFTCGSSHHETVPPLPAELNNFAHMFGIEQGLWIDTNLRNSRETITTESLLDRLLHVPVEEKILSSNDSHQALLLTWAKDRSPPPQSAEQSAMLYRLGWAIINSAMSRSGKKSRQLTARWASTVLVLALGGTLAAIPVPLIIEANAVLVPATTKEVFAPADGIIDKVWVSHGQRVRAGEPLIQLRSAGLSAEWERASAALAKSQKKLNELEGRLLRERSLTVVERDMLEGERNALREAIQYETKGLSILKSQLDSLRVCAQEDGIVETWRIQESLTGRPVRIGQWLFSVRSAATEWEFEAKVPERYLDELIESAGKSNAAARLISSPQQKVPLTISEPYSWRLSEPNPQETQSAYLVRFRTSVPISESIAVAGSSARISLDSGKTPLIWALTKDFFENITMRLRMWFQ